MKSIIQNLGRAFKKEGFIPLMLSLNELHEHLKNDLSKALIRRALTRYLRQEEDQRSVTEGQYLYNLAGEQVCEIKKEYRQLAQERIKRFENRKAKEMKPTTPRL